MARAQFQYDEVGNTFYYFVVSFYALLLLPATFYFWPNKKKSVEDKDTKPRCRCKGCEEKSVRKEAEQPLQKRKSLAIKVTLIILWIGFAFLAFKVTQIEVDHQEYDPYAILGLDRGASKEEVKKRYRELTKTVHPDRGGDPVQFDRIAKAHQALTDDEIRKNWEEHGNPDGPTATTFGIALPKWLVSKEYGVWVLAAYGFVFMVLLPVGVGIWWYNSIKYSVDQVLMDTTQLYGYMFHKTPHMIVKRVLMVLGSSFEFWKQYNKEIVERELDDETVPLLIKELPHLNEKSKERPMSLPYSIKARALIHAHLTRIDLADPDRVPPVFDTLEKDRVYVIRKCPILVQEMIQVVSQLVMYALSGRLSRMPTMETVESTMRVTPMLIQAIWDSRKPLLQLPHVSEDMVQHLKKRRIVTCSDLAAVENSKRRMMLRKLENDEYKDVLQVLNMMPRISMEYHVEVQGEDDKHDITAGSLVTLKVTLTRTPLLDSPLPSLEEDSAAGANDDQGDDDEDKDDNADKDKDGNADKDDNADEQDDDPNAQTQSKRKPWEKQQKKKKGGKPNKNKPKPKPPAKKAPANGKDGAAGTSATGDEAAASADSPKESREEKKEKKTQQRDKDEDDASDDDRSNDSQGSASASDEEGPQNFDMPHDEEADEDDMVFDDDLIKKDLVLETKSKVTHPVHCPFFPDDKYEWWWVYMVDKRSKRLAAGPVQCTTLVEKEVVELKFAAPQKPGIYPYTVVVKSDSYLDCDINKELKLNVLEARTVTSHPQWNFPDEDEEQKSDSEHLDATDYTEDDDDDD
uniref:J domain-containing protein n=1 Tax=Plectus sambesii TaxID=2011161 RepID=A0A914WPP5_9BILA